LASLSDTTPVQLAPGMASAKYTWGQRLADFGLSAVTDLQLNGVMPHMHQLGRKYRLQVSTASGSACAADVQNWDFHWQRMYFYDKPPALDTQTEFQVTCDYDTTSVTAPVLPGRGTSNEMCLAALYFTAPVSALQ
jgi:Copper type II ascorbate-dependent monooxygenase, C-terminal domain